MKGSYQSLNMHVDYRMPKHPNSISLDLSKEARQRLKWFDFYRSHQNNAELTCRHFGISKRTFYKWKARYDPHRLESLEARSRKPRRFRESGIPIQTINIIVELRKANPAWSKYKLEVILKREYGVNISASSVGRILKKRDMINPKDTRKRKLAAKRHRLRVSNELKVADFGDLVQFDLKHFNLPWGDKRFQITAIDVLGKKKISRSYSNLSSRSAKNFFLLAMNIFPFPIKQVQTDNGPEFLGEFEKLLSKLHIPHYFIYPNCPRQNSIVERAIQTDIKEFYCHCNFADTIDEQNRLLASWDDKYNGYRPHQALGYLTPDEFYREKKYIRIKPIKVAYVLDPSTVYYVMNQSKELTDLYFVV